MWKLHFWYWRIVLRLSITAIATFGGVPGISAPREVSYQEVFVQVGAFQRAAGAASRREELTERGYMACTMVSHDFHRVVVGPFAEEEEATTALARLQQDGYEAHMRRDLSSESVLGQSNSPGYTISGVVVDPSAAAVPEASVALIESEQTITETVTHSANGQFVFENISPGRYTVRVQKEDFKTSEIKVRIRNRSPGLLRIVLPLDELHEELTVYDSNNQVNTEISLNASAVTLDAELLENLPTMSQDVVSAVRGLVEAMSGEAATVIVDGLPVSDMTISPAEIKEIKINKDPYSAEYSKPGSGRISIKTKGGSRKFHGSARFGFRDYHMDARNAFAVERPQEHHRAYGGNLSGPLSEKGKTTFSVTFYRDEDSQRSIVNALGPSGPVRGNVPKRIESTSASSKIRHDLNDTNRLSIQYRFSDWSDEGESIGGRRRVSTTLPLSIASATTTRRSSRRVWSMSSGCLACCRIQLDRVGRLVSVRL